MRRHRYIWIVAIAIVCVIIVGGLTSSNGKVSRSTFALDTYITVTAYGPRAQDAVNEAIERIRNIEETMSAFREDSQVSYINRMAAQGPVKLEPELAAVVQSALRYTEITGGLFDITVEPLTRLWGITSDTPHVPSQTELDALLPLIGSDKLVFDSGSGTLAFKQQGMGIDLGGIAKGYAADEVARILRERGVQSALIDLGGNIVAIGPRRADLSAQIREAFTRPVSDRENWIIGIQQPFAPTGECCLKVHAKDRAVVSSGAYERNFEQNGIRYHHILDPRTGMPADSGLISVTVIGNSSMDADALSTSIFILGAEKGITLAQECGTDVILIDTNRKIHTTLEMTDVEIVNPDYSFAESH